MIYQIRNCCTYIIKKLFTFSMSRLFIALKLRSSLSLSLIFSWVLSRTCRTLPNVVESSAISKSPKNRSLSADFGNIGPKVEVGDETVESFASGASMNDVISDVCVASAVFS